MSSTVSLSIRQFVRFGLVAVAGVVTIAAASAGPITYTAAQQMACTPDAMRLCSDAIPDVAQVRACMIAHKSSLSAGCRRVF